MDVNEELCSHLRMSIRILPPQCKIMIPNMEGCVYQTSDFYIFGSFLILNGSTAGSCGFFFSLVTSLF